MGKERLVLDTNILISALGWKGNPRAIFQKILNGDFELLISSKQLKELMRVLDYPKFGFAEDKKSRFLSIILEAATLVEVRHKLNIIKEDPSDNMLLECALSGGADYLITGDRHLLKLKMLKNIKIITPKEFLDLA